MNHQARREAVLMHALDITVGQFYNEIRKDGFVFPDEANHTVGPYVEALGQYSELADTPDNPLYTDAAYKVVQQLAMMSDETLMWMVTTFHPTHPTWEA